MKNYYVPRLYISGYVHGFEAKAHKRLYAKGETLTRRGVINNNTYFICSGLVHLSLVHSSGNTKSIMFFWPDSIFPLGVVPYENLINYEMILRAVTDIEAYRFPYPTLRRLCVYDGEFAAQLLEENCRTGKSPYGSAICSIRR